MRRPAPVPSVSPSRGRSRRRLSVRPIPWAFVLEELARHYQNGDWRIPYLRAHAEDPFQVLVGTILSQRTRDEATDRAAAQLFARYPSVSALADAPLSEIERLIRPVGFYVTKARGIRATARAVRDRYHGEVPRDLDALLTLPMVGRKTANCTLVFGFLEPAIPVDTHVHRIANRLGAVRTGTPEETEAALRATVPRDLWIPLNPLLVQHGQNTCLPRRPHCERCPLVEVCATGIRGKAQGTHGVREGKGPPSRNAVAAGQDS